MIAIRSRTTIGPKSQVRPGLAAAAPAAIFERVARAIGAVPRASEVESNVMPAQSHESSGEVTRLLSAARAGDLDARDRLVALVYDELHALAQRQVRREYGVRTLHATALVHEAYIKLAGGAALDATNRTHFMATMSRVMRQVLIDSARKRKALKRGGGAVHATLWDGEKSVDLPLDDLIALDAALEQLDERQRQIVEYRFFGGLEELEIAELLGISDRTVRREWVKARAWLYRTLYPQGASAPVDDSFPPVRRDDPQQP